MNPTGANDLPPAHGAARWLARRDRGLSAAEQDAYLQWLRENPAHGAEIAALERTWTRLNHLADWQPAHSARPNPDLLAPRHRRTRAWAFAFGAAALVVLGVFVWPTQRAVPASSGVTMVQPGAQRLTLPDGSLVELNKDAEVAVHFTPAERAVTLVRGEAHFIVAKNPARPFVVTANRVTVRAVGTAFDVQMGAEVISVLVTEGKVQLNERDRLGGGSHQVASVAFPQQATLHYGTDAVDLRELTPTEIERALAWQTMRIQFSDVPLREIVDQFNRYNSRKLVLTDLATGDIRVGGSFRADNLDAFVRLLDLGFGVQATRQGDDIVLHRRE